MDETKRIGFFSALFNTGKAFTGDTESSNNIKEFDDLSEKEIAYSGVTQEQIEELKLSRKRVKEIVFKFLTETKANMKKAISKITQSNETKNKSIEQKEEIKAEQEYNIEIERN